MTFQWFALLFAVLAIARGCAAGDPPAEQACGGRAAPIDEQLLVSTLAQHGFELHRRPCEEGVLQPVASFENISSENWDTEEGDVIWASDGWVWCYLYDGSFFDAEVRRTRDGDYVNMDVLNVACSIEASDAAQLGRLERALAVLPKLAKPS